MAKYKFTLTKDYVSDWDVWPAVREILQNAQDNDNGVKIELNGDSLWITNPDTKLSINSLVMGVGTKTNDNTKIGGFSEGSLLAMLVLLREGKQIKVYNSDEVWIPSFEYDPAYDCELLTVDVLKTDEFSTDFSYRITGLTLQELDLLKMNSLLINDALGDKPQKVIDSDYGQIILDDRFSGKFYVEGLFIQDDASFEYGYSFKSDYVSLDRDRRAINYYDLLELTTDALTSQSDDITIVETSITKKYKDTSDLDSFYRNVSDEFAVSYAKHFIDKHNIDEDTFVGTEKETKVSGSSKTFVTDKVQARIVNQGLNKEEEYNNIKRLSVQKDNKDVAWQYYRDSQLKKLHDWLLHNCRRLSTKQINEFINISKEIKPSSFDLIKDDVYDSLITQIKTKNIKYRGEI